MRAELFSKDLNPDYGAADSSTALTAAMAAHQHLVFRPGVLNFTGPVTVDTLDNRGLFGTSIPGTGFTVNGTEFRTSATGTTPFLQLKGVRGFRSSGISWRYSSASFTGKLIEVVRNASDRACTFVTFEDGFFGSTNPSTTRTADAVFLFETGFTAELKNLHVGGADNLVRGPHLDFYVGPNPNHYWNGLTIEGGYWRNYNTAIVRNPAEGWVLNNLTAQGRYNGGGNGVGCAVLSDASRKGYGLTVNGGWYGDVTAATTDAWFLWRGEGLSINGGLYACSDGSLVKALEAIQGTSVHGVDMAGGSTTDSFVIDFTVSGADASTYTDVGGNRVPTGSSGGIYRSGTTPAS